ncbi:hypothetical protein LWI29_003383 [Acer saccharum]|uniref:Mitochondrial import inner membrane translocase subunit TIM50 n=1 Tax=Acer saccharum TaxID=4024 RepID=A0AA39VKD7_ACESA|nr:hypothetical protein LWI29_003383 [Acer saccharum]
MENDKEPENIPPNELQEDSTMYQMNKISTLSLSDEGNSAEIVVLSEVDEAKHDKEDNFSKISHSSVSRAPVNHLRKKLLILDLNGLLADIVSRPPKDRKADKKIANCGVFLRPFCLDFLWFCFERFEVAVWSSRKEKNVGKMVDFLMGYLKHKLLFCWDLSHCTATTYRTLENKHKVLVFKELRTIWEKDDPNVSWKKGDYNESNTLLVDDSPYKGLLNPPHTAIYPYSYHFQDTSDHSLGPGGDLSVYLEGLAKAENVQKFVEQHPFGQRALTEENASWDFYIEVINSLFIIM